MILEHMNLKNIWLSFYISESLFDLYTFLFVFKSV